MRRILFLSKSLTTNLFSYALFNFRFLRFDKATIFIRKYRYPNSPIESKLVYLKNYFIIYSFFSGKRRGNDLKSNFLLISYVLKLCSIYCIFKGFQRINASIFIVVNSNTQYQKNKHC